MAHYGWTFRNDEPHGRTAPRYIVVIGAILTANALATGILPKLLNVSYLTIQVGLAICAAAGSFLSQYLWVFRAKRPDAVVSEAETRAS